MFLHLVTLALLTAAQAQDCADHPVCGQSQASDCDALDLGDLCPVLCNTGCAVTQPPPTPTRNVSAGALIDSVHALEGAVDHLVANAGANAGAHAAFVALATDLTARTVATVAGQATATGRLDNIEEAAETMASRMQATGLALTSTMNAMAADITTDAAAAENSHAVAMASTMAHMSTVVTASISRVTATSASAVTAAQSAMRASNTSLFAAMGTRANTLQHVFMGGCSGRRNGGWNWYCRDRITLNTMMPKFQFDGANNWGFRARGAWFFRVTFFTITNPCGWAHHRLVVNGQDKFTTHGHGFYSHWKDSHVNAVFKGAWMMWFGIQAHVGCNHHALQPYGTGSRMEVHWLGSDPTA